MGLIEDEQLPSHGRVCKESGICIIPQGLPRRLSLQTETSGVLFFYLMLRWSEPSDTFSYSLG